jgi:quinohemoprotein ethanol dehydrogenase
MKHEVSRRAAERNSPGTVYTLVFGGTAKAPEFVTYQQGALLKDLKYDPDHVKEGRLLYVSNCVLCHGVPGVQRGGNVSNLGYSATTVISELDTFVFNGPHVEGGIPDFTGKLKPEEVEKIKAFIQGTADAIRPK